MTPLTILIVVLISLFLLFLASIRKLIVICAPNEVLIFAGKRRRDVGRTYGYRLVKGGMGFRVPLLETVDRMDLTNMTIDVTAVNAYSKGGVPLTVQGVANIKIAGHEPVLNNSIERFLGKTRIEIMDIAKATLEGSLRGVLATLTPEQVNEDKILFAERLVQEVEQDMTNLGLVVDTLKIQNVSDEVKYLDSIGRKKSAEVVANARIAEAKAHAESALRSAQNKEAEVSAQVTAEIAVAKADAQRRLTDTLTKRNALVAEELSTVTAAVAQATAEMDVQKARTEQVRQRLDADVIQPAKAACEASENAARASTASIVEEGKARSQALVSLAESWQASGTHAREIFVLQKLEPILQMITSTISETPIEKITMIDTGGSGGGASPAKWIAPLEQIKALFGIDVVQKLKELPDGKSTKAEATQAAPAPEQSTTPPPKLE